MSVQADLGKVKHFVDEFLEGRYNDHDTYEITRQGCSCHGRESWHWRGHGAGAGSLGVGPDDLRQRRAQDDVIFTNVLLTSMICSINYRDGVER